MEKSELKYYDSIHNCIVKNWYSIIETGDYRHLLILPSYKNLPDCDIDLKSVFNDMILEKYDNFGYHESEQEVLRREAKRNELEIKYNLGGHLLYELLKTEYGTERYLQLRVKLEKIKIKLNDSHMQMSYIGAVQNLLQSHKSIINSVQRIDREIELLSKNSDKSMPLRKQAVELSKAYKGKGIDFNYNVMTVAMWFSYIEMASEQNG